MAITRPAPSSAALRWAISPTPPQPQPATVAPPRRSQNSAPMNPVGAASEHPPQQLAGRVHRGPPVVAALLPRWAPVIGAAGPAPGCDARVWPGRGQVASRL